MCRCEALTQAREGTAGDHFASSLRDAEKGTSSPSRHNRKEPSIDHRRSDSDREQSGKLIATPETLIVNEDFEPAYMITVRRFEMADVAAKVLGGVGKWTFAISYLFGIFVVSANLT